MKRQFSVVLQLNVMVAVCALLSAIVGAPGYAQSSPSTKPGEAMQTFVLIFHQGFPTPTAEERQRVAGDVVAWADKLNAEGHKLDPRILKQEGRIRGENGSAPLSRGAWPITALLFLEARDLEEAIGIADSHPALRNRAVIEVRQWNPPVRPAQR
jgi:hypothetical protein